MLVLNFALPFTPEQTAAVCAMLGAERVEVRDIPVHIDTSQPLARQAVALVDACGLSPAEWQTTSVLVRPATLPEVSAAIMAEIHGRKSIFPICIAMRQSSVGSDDVWDLVDLQTVREMARAMARRRRIA